MVDDERDMEGDHIELSGKEHGSVIMSFGGVSTASFYRCCHGAPPTDLVTARVHAIVQANPWLGCNLATADGRT